MTKDITKFEALPRGDPELGILLERWRESAGFTQDHVSKLLGIARPTYIGIAQGTRGVTTNELRQLASIYEVSISQLLEPNGNLPPPKRSAFWEVLIDEARELSVQDRIMVLEFVRFLRARGK